MNDTTKERIELARKRIDELILLIDTWKDNDQKNIHTRKEKKNPKHTNVWEWEDTPAVKAALDKLHKRVTL